MAISMARRFKAARKIAASFSRFNTNGLETNIYSFTGGNDGGNPPARLALGGDGELYGTTSVGGTNGYGVVFKISTNGAFTSLYSFNGIADGSNPNAGLTTGSGGAFYGTAQFGGSSNSGTIFKITTNGVLTNLYSFTGGNDGVAPAAALAQGADGLLYGTAVSGGTNRAGAVFKVTTSGTLGKWYSFLGGTDGGNSAASPGSRLARECLTAPRTTTAGRAAGPAQSSA